MSVGTEVSELESSVGSVDRSELIGEFVESFDGTILAVGSLVVSVGALEVADGAIELIVGVIVGSLDVG